MLKKIWWLIAIFAVLLGLGRVYQTTFAQGTVTVASPLAAAGFTCVDPRPVQGRIYAIMNVNSGLAMDVLDNGGSGASVVQYTFYGGENQEWQFVPLGDGLQFTISPLHAQGLYLDMQGDSQAEGAQIEVSSSLNSTMNWAVIGNGILQFGSLISTKYIGVQDGSNALLANIVQYADGTPDYMKWQLYTQPINGACPSGSTPTATNTPVPPTATNTPVPPTVTPTPTNQAFSCTNVTEIPQIECEALVALYSSTNGANWDIPKWLVTITPCSWAGVTCNNNRVTQLSLGVIGLFGTIPAQLGNLRNLQYLDLKDNYLSGSIPPELGNLANLQYLNLNYDHLSGSIPVQLGNLTNVQYLYLFKNYLSGSIPPQLGNLTNLQGLSLSSNQLSGTIPPELGNLTNVQELSLSSNQLSGSIPVQLGNLTNVQVLDLGSNQLSGSIPVQLGNLTNVQWLYLGGNQLSGSIPVQLGNLTNVRELGLGSNQLSGAIPPELGNLTNLQYLHLDYNQLSGSIPPELGNLHNLGELTLSNTQLSGALPSSLINLTTLGRFFFNNTSLCEPADTAFQAWLAHLTYLQRTGVKCAAPTATSTFTPTPTSTSVPPTLTATRVPPIPTSTPVPPTATTTPVPSLDAAELAAQEVNPTVGPGESVHIWINLRNSGNATWRASTGYGWRGTGVWDARSGAIWRDVPPGDVVAFAEDIIAPRQPGEYIYGFVLRHSGQDFGPHFFIKVTVKLLPVVLVQDWNKKTDSWGYYTGEFLPSIGLTGRAAMMYTGADDIPPWSIDDNAKSLTLFIQRVKQETGAKQVDIVAHGMGGLIARRYIGRYMNANTPDVHQLIMLGTPNAGSNTAVVNQLAYYLGATSNPSSAELTPASVEQFNLNPENRNRHGVPFYVIAGSYYCQTKFPKFNLLEPNFNDIFVATSSAFAISFNRGWTFPPLLGGCKGDHRGMLDDASDEGGLDIFNRYVKPLLQGGMPEQSTVQASNIGQKDNTLQALDTMSQVQFTGVQTGTLRPGTSLTFRYSSESTSHVSFLVVGPPEQMSVSMRDPNGQLILPNTSNPAIQYTQMDKNILPFTSYTISNPVPGMWTTIVEANTQTPASGITVAALGSLVSDLRLTLPVAAITPVILQPISIAAQLQSGDTPLLGANVNAQVILPDQKVNQITLLDDGLHGDGKAGDGIYGYQFTPLTVGVYSASIRAEGVNGTVTFQRSAVWSTQVDGNQVFLPMILRR